jgi:hypothetical protein
MKVYRIQCTYYDEYGESTYLLEDVYISGEIAEKYKPKDCEYPNEEYVYEVIDQEIIEE